MPLNTDFSAVGIARGTILRVRLNPVEGSEQGGERPCIVVSPSIINDNMTVLLVAIITSKKVERLRTFEALIEPPNGGVALSSKAMLMQLRVVDRSRIVEILGVVSDETMARVEEALKIATGIGNV